MFLHGYDDAVFSIAVSRNRREGGRGRRERACREGNLSPGNSGIEIRDDDV